MKTGFCSGWVSCLTSAAVVGGTVFVPLASAAAAMGSPNPFQNAQVGLTYPVYQPTTTLGLPRSSFKLFSCGVGKEESLFATYGTAYTPSTNFGKTKGFSVSEGYPMFCANPGISKSVATRTVGGAIIHVSVYCDPSQFKNCTLASGVKNGYLLQWSQPYKPTQTLKKRTQIYLDTSLLTLAQALSIAGGLTPA